MEPRVWGGTTVRSNIPRLDTLQNATNERTTTSNCYHFFVFEEGRREKFTKFAFDVLFQYLVWAKISKFMFFKKNGASYWI